MEGGMEGKRQRGREGGIGVTDVLTDSKNV